MRHATHARRQRGGDREADREQAQTRKKQALDVTRNWSYLRYPSPLTILIRAFPLSFASNPSHPAAVFCAGDIHEVWVSFKRGL